MPIRKASGRESCSDLKLLIYFAGLKWKRHTSTLLTYIFDCAHKCFLYDTDGFVNKERFEVLMQPLVDQVSFF